MRRAALLSAFSVAEKRHKLVARYGLDTMSIIVTSTDNPSVKLVRALGKRRDRQRERAFVVEGVRLLDEALLAGGVPRIVLFAREVLGANDVADRILIRLGDLQERVGHSIRVLEVTPDVLRSVAETETPQGVVAVFPFVEQRPPLPGSPLLVIADGVRDPGNLGTLLRTALGAGATGFFTTARTVDAYNPKVVRAAMGAHFRLPLRTNLGWEALEAELGPEVTVIGAAVDGEVDYATAGWAAPVAVVIGNEDRGLSVEARARCAELVTIPLRGGLESLNVAIAAAALLFEAARQRRGK